MTTYATGLNLTGSTKTYTGGTNTSTTTGPLGPLGPVTAAGNPFNATKGVTVPSITKSGPANQTPHAALVAVGGELLFVVIAVVIANTGPKAATAMVALFGLLWLLYLINHFDSTGG